MFPMTYFETKKKKHTACATKLAQKATVPLKDAQMENFPASPFPQGGERRCDTGSHSFKATSVP